MRRRGIQVTYPPHVACPASKAAARTRTYCCQLACATATLQHLGVPLNSDRYDTPTLRGFSFAASWGVDDFWDIAGRYAAEWNGVKVAAAVAYSEQHDEDLGFAVVRERDSAYLQAGLYVQHVPTGLFYSAYGEETNDHKIPAGFSTTTPPVPLFKDIPDNDHWYLKVGVRRLWTPLGHTVLYSEYAQHNDMLSEDLINGIPNLRPLQAGAVSSTFAADDSELERWGCWPRPTVTTATTDPNNNNGRTVRTTRGKIDFDEIHFIGVGALINF